MHNKMQSKLPVKWIIIYHPKFQFTIPQKRNRKCIRAPYINSLANKTVVQLRPKSTTGSSFLLEYILYFCRRVWSITPQKSFCVCVKVNNCFVFLCLILVWFCYINDDFAGADTGTSLLYWHYRHRTPEGYEYGTSYWLTYVSYSQYKCIVTPNA